MRRVLILFFIIAACGGTAASTTVTSSIETTTIAPPTTTTAAPTTTTTAAPTTTTLSEAEIAQAELAVDTNLIANLYRDYSDSWYLGVEAGYQFLAAHNHPSLECTVDEFRSFFEWAEGSTDESIVHQATVERQDGWILPDTAAVPEGRIYVYQITYITDEPGYDPVETLREVHASVIDGDPFFFYPCRELA